MEDDPLAIEFTILSSVENTPEVAAFTPATTNTKVYGSGRVVITSEYPVKDGTPAQTKTTETNVVELRIFQTITHTIQEIVNGRVPPGITAEPSAEGGVTSVAGDAAPRVDVRPDPSGAPAE